MNIYSDRKLWTTHPNFLISQNPNSKQATHKITKRQFQTISSKIYVDNHSKSINWISKSVDKV